MFLRHISLAVAALTLATSATAQPAGTWELGAAGRYSGFADVLHLNDAYGGGAWIGFFPIPRLELEVASSVTSTDHSLPPVGDAIYVPVKARLTYNQPLLNMLDLRIGAGYIYNTYRIDPDWYGDSGVTALLGTRLYVSRSVAVLLSGTADYLPAYSDRTDVFGELVSWGLEAGISVLLGGRPRPTGPPVVLAAEPVEVQERQAPVDSDGDGIPDGADRCPGTPAGITVGASGCPPPVVEEPAPQEEAPPPDSDGDGVSDSRDRCPETAAGLEVDSEGCPLRRDSDGDGVLDSEDRCAETPPGSEVDSVGCPVLIDIAAVEVTLEGAFRSGTWDLTPSAEKTLDGVARVMLGHPTLRIEIAGYTDNVGEERRNLWLSQTRADAVKLYLSSRGVARDRMVTRGYGPADPVASNQTPEGRARNRRVEIRRIQ